MLEKVDDATTNGDDNLRTREARWVGQRQQPELGRRAQSERPIGTHRVSNGNETADIVDRRCG